VLLHFINQQLQAKHSMLFLPPALQGSISNQCRTAPNMPFSFYQQNQRYQLP